VGESAKGCQRALSSGSLSTLRTKAFKGLSVWSTLDFNIDDVEPVPLAGNLESTVKVQ
jgi:hypothetical protein